MELNITEFCANETAKDFSASVAEIGNNAGLYTWNAANDVAEYYNLLNTEEKREAFKLFIDGFGAWEPEEVSAWSNVELTALLIQSISGDMRDFSDDPIDSWDWGQYQKASEEGQISGSLFQGTDNEIYYYIGE